MEEFGNKNPYIEVRVYEEMEPETVREAPRRWRRRRNRIPRPHFNPVVRIFKALFTVVRWGFRTAASAVRMVRDSAREARARDRAYRQQRRDYYRKRMEAWAEQFSTWMNQEFDHEWGKHMYWGSGCEKKRKSSRW